MTTDRQTILVTGSTDGVGRRVAVRLGAQGAHVLVHGRDRARGEAVAAVRAGKWNLTVGNFPETAGRLAIDQVVNKIRGKHTSETVNIDEVAPVPLVLTADVLKQHPDFRGEWSG